MSLLRKVVNRIIAPRPTAQQLRVAPWFKINGDKTLRLEYDLDKNSLIFDLGGYEGQWASDIYAKYRCKIFIFEPHLPYADNIKKRFKKNEDISTFSFGLASTTKEIELGISGDSSSMFKKQEATSIIKLECASSFFDNHKITKVDLMKINIEGGEFDLLDHLISTGLIKKIYNIQVQFHDFVPNAIEWRKRIQDELNVTHQLTYNFDFVWENWAIRQ